MENPNDVPVGFVTSGGEDNRPRIKIKIKSVLDGSNTHTIFYVPNDSIEPPRSSASCEALTTSTPLASPVVVPPVTPTEKVKPTTSAPPSTSRPQSALASASAPVISQNPPVKPPSGRGASDDPAGPAWGTCPAEVLAAHNRCSVMSAS